MTRVFSGSSREVVLLAAVICQFACSAAPSNTTEDPTGSTGAAPAPAALVSPDYDGNHESADCIAIGGWIRDANNLDTAVTVDVFDGDTQLGTATADKMRPDLVSAGLGTGRYGFRFTPPASVRDGKPHSIRVKVSGAGSDLRSTPRSLTCNGQTSLYEGRHEAADCSGISGWIWNGNQPETAVKVDILDGNTRVATVDANQPRQDLIDVGIGSGSYGFSYALPAGLKDGRSHIIRVTISGTNTDVPNTPRALMCSAG